MVAKKRVSLSAVLIEGGEGHETRIWDIEVLRKFDPLHGHVLG